MSIANGVPLSAEGAATVANRAFDPYRALRRLYHNSRTFCERALHPRRHRALRLKLSKSPRPRRILVVCHGNICRSPYMHAVLQRSLPDVLVMSAGFVGSERPVPQNSVALSAQRGLDLARYRSQPLTQAKVIDADLVIVMNAEQAREISEKFLGKRDRIIVAGDLEPTFAGSRAIRDPWNESIDVFRESFDRLDRCAAALVALLPPRQPRV